MQLFDRTKIDFMGHRRAALIVSIIAVAISIGSLAIRGLNYGIEFTGGVVIEADLRARRGSQRDPHESRGRGFREGPGAEPRLADRRDDPPAAAERGHGSRRAARARHRHAAQARGQRRHPPVRHHRPTGRLGHGAGEHPRRGVRVDRHLHLRRATLPLEARGRRDRRGAARRDHDHRLVLAHRLAIRSLGARRRSRRARPLVERQDRALRSYPREFQASFGAARPSRS